jgi:PPOX class probable F420-dependent enzyme
MSDEEVGDFLSEQAIMQCATMSPAGRPHMVPLWYLAEGLELRAWTYAKSQKARNLERDPRATLGIEEGVEYHELRGVMLEADVELERDGDRVADLGLSLYERYTGADLGSDVRQMVMAQAPKRVGMRFVPTRVVSWDHRKLSGGY